MQTTLMAIPLIGAPGMWEIILIAALILLLFGATRLPKLGKGLGQSIRNFKTGLKGEEPTPPQARVEPPAEKPAPAAQPPSEAADTDEEAASKEATLPKKTDGPKDVN